MSALAILLGVVLATGLLLAASPWLWPAGRAGRGNRRGRAGIAERMRVQLTLAGLPRAAPGALAAVSALVGIIAAALVQALFGVVALALAAGLAALTLPALLVVWRARNRRLANRTVWPDVVDHLVSAVRAGLALPDAVGSLSASGPPTTRTVFAQFEADYRATGDFGVGLDELKRTFADPVADRLFETLRMAREVGGSDLIEVLRALAAYLRDDAVVRAELRARQGWVVNAARLGVVAPWVVLLLLVSRPEGALAYNSPTGTVVILLALVLSVIAYRLMIRVGRLPEEQRWFQ